MKLVGLMACRNEDWCIGLTLRAALMWCDEVIVFAHACTDDTWRIVFQIKEESPGRVLMFGNDCPVWEEMSHRQQMLELARAGDAATHIAYVDADELLTGNLLPSIRGHIERLQVGQMLSLPWLQLRDNVGYVMSTGMWSQSMASVAFRDSPELHWSSAGRGGYDFHQREPLGRSWRQIRPVSGRGAGLMHLQFLSARRLHAKQMLYKLTERLRWPARKMADYDLTVRESRVAQVSPVPRDWWLPYESIAHHLHIDREPWQLDEIRRIRREHPGIEAGLDDFGLNLQESVNV